MTSFSSTPSVSAYSLQGRSVIPSRRSISSRDAGWSSLLLELHTGVASSEPYSSIATPDQIIGVAMSGQYVSEVRLSRGWLRGVYHPGAVCIHTPLESRRYRFPAPERGHASFTTALLYLPQSVMTAAAEHLRRAGQRSPGTTLRGVDRDPVVAQLTAALLRAMGAQASNLYAETATAWLAVHLLTMYGSPATSTDLPLAGHISDARLARVVEFMSVNFNRRLTLDELAAEAAVSKFHFARLFREKVGRSPLAFLAELRLDSAHRLLITSDLPVAIIGYECGYSSPSHFTAAFSARYGVTPSAFRTARGRA
jgi:AraC family transcriptional regulator